MEEAIQLAIKDANGIIRKWRESANIELFNHDDLKAMIKTTIVKRLRSYTHSTYSSHANYYRKRLKSSPIVTLNNDFSIKSIEFPSWDSAATDINTILRKIDLKVTHSDPSYPWDINLSKSIESLHFNEIKAITF